MIEHKTTFDHTQPSDCEEIFTFLLQQPSMSNYKEIFNSEDRAQSYSYNSKKTANDVNKINMEGSNNRIEELQITIDKYQQNNKKIKELLTENDEKIKELNNIIKQKNDKNETLINDIEKIKNDYNETLALVEELRKKNNSDMASKEKEIQNLKSVLSNYDAEYASDDPSARIYFKVSDNSTLEETRSKPYSLFYANKKSDNYVYTINDEGPIMDALKDIDKFILPFCEIKNRMDSANWIKVEALGNAKYTSNTLTIITKLKVSLIKQ